MYNGLTERDFTIHKSKSLTPPPPVFSGVGDLEHVHIDGMNRNNPRMYEYDYAHQYEELPGGRFVLILLIHHLMQCFHSSAKVRHFENPQKSSIINTLQHANNGIGTKAYCLLRSSQMGAYLM